MKARTFQIGKGERMYQGFEHEMARERAAQMRKEVARNRLESRSARAARSDGDVGIPRGKVARGAALVAALFGAHSAS